MPCSGAMASGSLFEPLLAAKAGKLVFDRRSLTEPLAASRFLSREPRLDFLFHEASSDVEFLLDDGTPLGHRS